MPLSSLSSSEMHELRASALAALFSAFVTETSASSAVDYISESNNWSKKNRENLLEYLKRAEDASRLEALFSKHLSASWPLSRLAVVDRMILRLAVMELYDFDHIPPKVTIAESLKLAEEFGDEKSARFIHGVLSSVLKESPKAEWKAPANDRQKPAESASESEATEAAGEDAEIPLTDSPWQIKSKTTDS